MKKLTLALAAATAMFAAPALAADLRAPVRAPAAYAPAPAYGLWNGFYIGANVGYGAGAEDTGFLDSFTLGAGIPAAVATGAIPGNFAVQRDGIVGGGQIGYNFQTGMFVFGVEADIQGSGIEGSTTIIVPPGGGVIGVTSNASTSLDWFGTVRGRIGIAFDRALIYATGGFAYGGVEDAVTVAGTIVGGPNFTGSNSNTRTGYTVGGGFEYAFSPNWSLKAEYLYVDLGTSIVTTRDAAFPGEAIAYGFDHNYHIGRIGVNYKFGGPGPVMASY